MEPYLPITQINDFTFCPKSLYFGGIFRENRASETFHARPQTVGSAAHRRIDEGIYSTRADVLSGVTVYSERYGLVGKIDLFDVTSGVLTERKHSVSAVYPGLRYQLYAQAFALEEMGYAVNRLRIHALKDNRLYEVPLPNADDVAAFEAVLAAMRVYRPDDPIAVTAAKCRHCIYSPLCDLCEEENESAVLS